MNPIASRLFRNYGIALAVAGALIWFPLTGFFLVFLTGGLLLSLICNMFLIHLACAACTRRISLGWLVIPIICYGVWLGWVIPQNNLVSMERSRLESENHVTGAVPQNVTLVFAETDFYFAKSVRLHLDSSVRVFAGLIELSTIKDRQRGCMAAQPNDPPFIKPSRCPTEPISLPPDDAIVFRQLERPDPRSKSRTYLYRYELKRKSASNADPVFGHFNHGALRAIAWAPLFRAGCVLIDDPPAWQCGISPMERRVPIGETGYAEPYEIASGTTDPVIVALANMLGVKYVEDQPRRVPAKMPTVDSVPSSNPSASDANETIHRD